MLPLLRISASRPIHGRPVAGGVAVACDDLRIVFQILRHDGLASGVRAWAKGVDRANAQGAESFDLKREFDHADGRPRSRDGAAGDYAFYDKRVPAPPRLDCA